MSEKHIPSHQWDTIITKHGYKADEVISALQKSIRRGKEDDAVFFAYEMLVTSDEMGDKFWQRMRVIAMEDVGLANPNLSPTIAALHETFRELKGREDAMLAGMFATVLLTRSDKSRYIDELYNNLRTKVETENYSREIPDYALDKHTARGEEMGRDMLHFWETSSVITKDVSTHEKQHYEEVLQRLKAEE
jgi:replication-associated recombination protein RarA